MFGTAGLSSNIQSYLLITVFVFGLSACSSKSNSEECLYDRIDTLAEVKELKPHPDGDGRIAVILDFKASKLAFEDQELGELKNTTIDHDFLVRNNIEIGNKYEVVVSEITKGNCIPRFVSFNHAFE